MEKNQQCGKNNLGLLILMNVMTSYDKAITFLCIHLLEIQKYFKYSNRNMQNHCTTILFGPAS